MIEKLLIAEYYRDRTAKRSGVPLMNHIHEGLAILDKIGASDLAKRAFCLHPLFQADDELVKHFKMDLLGVEASVIILTMEYRSVANEYLSHRKINAIQEIRLSPLKDVNDMLIADKVQNRKDFEIYHRGVHERSDELDQYFKNWLKRLNIDENLFKTLKHGF
jgi:hypothetical protein